MNDITKGETLNVFTAGTGVGKSVAMCHITRDKLEWEVKRHKDIALILADQLNEKIDECQNWKEHCRALREEVARLRGVIEEDAQ